MENEKFLWVCLIIFILRNINAQYSNLVLRGRMFAVVLHAFLQRKSENFRIIKKVKFCWFFLLHFPNNFHFELKREKVFLFVSTLLSKTKFLLFQFLVFFLWVE